MDKREEICLDLARKIKNHNLTKPGLESALATVLTYLVNTTQDGLIEAREFVIKLNTLGIDSYLDMLKRADHDINGEPAED
jgi:hypothetical protein